MQPKKRKRIKTILIVDYNDAIRKLLAKIIQRTGYQTLDASCGKEVTDIYKENKPNCVFIDVRLSEIDTPQLLKKIIEMDPKVGAYFITGVSNEGH